LLSGACTLVGMSPETQAILERRYEYAKRGQKKLGPPTAAERASAAREGYPVGAKLTLDHDAAVRRLRAAAAAVRAEDVTEAFVAGVGGSALVGRQAMVSYAAARHLRTHAADPTPGYKACRVCGIEKRVSVDTTEEALRAHLGFVWNEGVEGYFVALEELLRPSPPKPTKADRAVLRDVLVLAASADAATTPGQLEKAIAAKKLIPSSDRYARYGILEALAMVGVLPNPLIAPEWDRLVTRVEVWEASRRVKGGPRSDVVLPFGGWRGKEGVYWRRAKELFGVTPK